MNIGHCNGLDRAKIRAINRAIFAHAVRL